MKKGSIILRRIFWGLFLVVFVCITIFVAAGMVPAKDNVPGVRTSTYVTMRDGIKIAVRVILPVGLKDGEKVPAIMESTRYCTQYKRSFLLNALVNLKIAKEIPPATIVRFLESGYAFVAVDARGSGASFGSRGMELSKEETDDMVQVIDWISKQSWSNGKVGTYGMSYSGNTAELAVASDHPALMAAAPLYPDFDVFTQSVAPGGILNEFLVKNWCEANEMTDANEKSLFNGGTEPVSSDKNGNLLKQAVKSHNTFDLYTALNKITYYNDILAEDYIAGSLAPYFYKDRIEKSGIPLYVRVGWQDAGTVNGAIERFLTYKNRQTLVIGPWSHAGHYFCDPFLEKQITRKELDKSQAEEITAFFDSYLKSDIIEADSADNVIKYYTLGEGKWKTTNIWPVKGFGNKILYFDDNGSLNEIKPLNIDGKDTYVVDFTTTTGETNRWRTNLGGGPIVYPDRAEEDKKLLTYTSEAMKKDVEITGVPVVTLKISSTATDGAFFVYLEDVAPDGKVTYITEGELRALHRKVTDEDLGRAVLGPIHSFLRKDGELLKPEENTELKIGMYATSVLIKKGHRIRIAIAGQDTSNFKRIPEKEHPIITVQRNSVYSSYVELPMKIIE